MKSGLGPGGSGGDRRAGSGRPSRGAILRGVHADRQSPQSDPVGSQALDDHGDGGGRQGGQQKGVEEAVADAVHPDRGFHRLHRISPLLHDFRAFLLCRWVNVASFSLRLNGATPVLEIEDRGDLVEKHVTYRLTMLNFRNASDGTKVAA